MKKNLENIKNELAMRGIRAEEVEVVKNGISCVGFQIITNSNVRPVVYYSQNETLSSFSIEDAWKAALCNMKSAICVRSMAAVLGMPEELFPAPFHVVTTENGMDGASALLYPEIFNSYCQQHEIDACIILPSSTQEVLVVPDEDGICYDDFAGMVNEVNNEEVDPMIRLDPVVYRYDIVSNEIKIVAEV